MGSIQGRVFMANTGYMSITGKIQGLISAGCSSQDSIGNKCQAGHLDEVMVLSYSHNMANIGKVNKSTHRPIVLKKILINHRHYLLRRFQVEKKSNARLIFIGCPRSGSRKNFIPYQLRAALFLI